MEQNQDNKKGADLSKRMGCIQMGKDFIKENAYEALLREIFSNFFPAFTDKPWTYHSVGSVLMFGYSKHFREVGENEITPEYNIVFQTDEHGHSRFKEMVEVKLPAIEEDPRIAKYEELKKAVGEFYPDYDDKNNEIPAKREGDLGDIGELAARTFGYLT